MEYLTKISRRLIKDQVELIFSWWTCIIFRFYVRMQFVNVIWPHPLEHGECFMVVFELELPDQGGALLMEEICRAYHDIPIAIVNDCGSGKKQDPALITNQGSSIYL